VGALRKDIGKGGRELLPSAKWSEKLPPMQMIFVGCAIGGKTVTKSRLQYPLSFCLPPSKFFFAESTASWTLDCAFGSLRKSRSGSEEAFAPVISATLVASTLAPILFSSIFCW